MRTLKIAVVNSEELLLKALRQFRSLRHKKDAEPVLFIYNIGPDELDGDKYLGCISDRTVLCIFNCDSDLLSKKQYGGDYLSATADATIIAQQMVGVDCELPTFYNFFKQPKDGNFRQSRGNI
jgi:hypothetical protein